MNFYIKNTYQNTLNNTKLNIIHYQTYFTKKVNFYSQKFFLLVFLQKINYENMKNVLK